MRKLLPISLVVLIGVIFIGRLFYLQVYDASSIAFSESNAVKATYDYPQRGHIYDRNNKLLVSNQPSYDLMVIPKDVKPFDTLALCRLLHIEKSQLLKELRRAKNYSYRLPSVVVPTMTKEEYALLAEKMRLFDGFYIQKRSLRDYQINFGANFLGYIQEANQSTIEKDPILSSRRSIGPSRCRTTIRAYSTRS